MAVFLENLAVTAVVAEAYDERAAFGAFPAARKAPRHRELWELSRAAMPGHGEHGSRGLGHRLAPFGRDLERVIEIRRPTLSPGRSPDVA